MSVTAVAAREGPSERTLQQWWAAVHDCDLFREIEPGIVRLTGARQRLARYWAISPGSLTDRLRRLEQTGAVLGDPGRGQLVISRGAVARALGLTPLSQPTSRATPERTERTGGLDTAQARLLDKIEQVDDPAAITELARALTAITGYLQGSARNERRGFVADLPRELAANDPRNRDADRDLLSQASAQGGELNENHSDKEGVFAFRPRPDRDSAGCPPTERPAQGQSDWPTSEWSMLVAPLAAAWRRRTGEQADLAVPHIVDAAQLWSRAELEPALRRLQDDIERDCPIRNLGGLLYIVLSEGRYRYFPLQPEEPSEAVAELADAVAGIGGVIPSVAELVADPACRSLLESAATAGLSRGWLRHETGRRPWPADRPPLEAIADILRSVVRGAKPAAARATQDPTPEDSVPPTPVEPVPDLTADEIYSLCTKAAIPELVRHSPSALKAAVAAAWQRGVRP